jgi:hypothetical protein
MTYQSIILLSDRPTNEELTQLTSIQKIEQNPDVLVIEPLEGKQSISIDQVHSISQEMSFTPVKEQRKVVLILRAHTLTLPAQQSLLKTLEEPPENTHVILATSQPHRLLPTILSRTTTHESTSLPHAEHIEPSQPLYSQLTTMSVSTCIARSDEWGSSKEETIQKLHQLLLEVRLLSHQNLSSQVLHHEKAIMTCIAQLEKNVNVKLALDDLFFSLCSKK